MKTPVISNDKINVDIIANEIMRFMLKFGIVLCALIGTLAFTCLAPRLISVGPLQMARGYITAITGF